MKKTDAFDYIYILGQVMDYKEIARIRRLRYGSDHSHGTHHNSAMEGTNSLWAEHEYVNRTKEPYEVGELRGSARDRKLWQFCSPYFRIFKERKDTRRTFDWPFAFCFDAQYPRSFWKIQNHLQRDHRGKKTQLEVHIMVQLESIMCV
uniref:hypothetical protein n=1 Tax=Helicobacter pylori TaxID=210 RepID=UPI00215B0A7A|nr:hypothetical protein [Helicobacter pylori]